MPSQLVVTCDLCGKDARRYDSPFVIHGGKIVVPARELGGLFAGLYLCDEHFGGFRTACETWFEEQSVPEVRR